MKKIFLCFMFIFVSSIGITAIADKSPMVIINGLPLKKGMSDIEGTEQVTLSKDESANYRLLITKKGDKYFWASRENKELLFRRSGEFYNFIEPNGAGYIKIINTEGKILYMEHLTIALKNITYWGVAIEYNLK